MAQRGGWRRIVWRGERGVTRETEKLRQKKIKINHQAAALLTKSKPFLNFIFFALLRSGDKESEGIWQGAVDIWKQS